jgi:hypothetical protein
MDLERMPIRSGFALGAKRKQFQEKWIPLFRPKLRKTNDPRAVFDSSKSQTALD